MTEYLLCTRHKSKMKKPVSICRKCRKRSGCKSFQKWEQPELTMRLQQADNTGKS